MDTASDLDDIRQFALRDITFPDADEQRAIFERTVRLLCRRHFLLRSRHVVCESRTRAPLSTDLLDGCGKDSRLLALAFDDASNDKLPLLPAPSAEQFIFGLLPASFYLNLIRRVAEVHYALDREGALRCAYCDKRAVETEHLLTVDRSAWPQGPVCSCHLDADVNASQDDGPVHLPVSRFCSAETEGGGRSGEAVCLKCLWDHVLTRDPELGQSSPLSSIFALRDILSRSECYDQAAATALCRILPNDGETLCAFQFSRVTTDADAAHRQRLIVNAHLATRDETPTIDVGAPDVAAQMASLERDVREKLSLTTPIPEQKPRDVARLVDVFCKTASPTPAAAPADAGQGGVPWDDMLNQLQRVADFVRENDLVVPLPAKLPSILHICSLCGQPAHLNGKRCPLLHRSFDPQKRDEEGFHKHLGNLLQDYAPGGKYTQATATFVDATVGFLRNFIAILDDEVRVLNTGSKRSLDLWFHCGNILERQQGAEERDTKEHDECVLYHALRLRNAYQLRQEVPVRATAWPTVPRAYLQEIMDRKLRPCHYLDMASFTSATDIETVISHLSKRNWDMGHHDHLLLCLQRKAVSLTQQPLEDNHVDAISVESVFKRYRVVATLFIEESLDADLQDNIVELRQAFGKRKPPRKRTRRGTAIVTQASTGDKQTQLARFEVQVQEAHESAFLQQLVAARDELFDNFIAWVCGTDYYPWPRYLTIPELSDDTYDQALQEFRQMQGRSGEPFRLASGDLLNL